MLRARPQFEFTYRIHVRDTCVVPDSRYTGWLIRTTDDCGQYSVDIAGEGDKRTPSVFNEPELTPAINLLMSFMGHKCEVRVEMCDRLEPYR